MALRKTMGRALAAGVLALAACSPAPTAERSTGPAAPIRSDLPGAATLAATAAERAALLCAAGADGLRPDPAAYRQETWADVTELVGRAELPRDGDLGAARIRALGEVRTAWRGDSVVDEGGWDHTEVATVACPDRFLYAVQVLARAPAAGDAGTYRRAHLPASAIRHREGLRYRTVPDVAGRPVDLLLDLFLPPSTADPRGRPTLLLVHGGGFAAGSRSQHADEARAWARHGFVVATLDYRVDPDAGETATAHREAGFAAVDDAMEAVRWLRARARSLDVDPDRIAALGASAGGGIALGLALLDDLSPEGAYAEVSPRVAAAFSTGTYLTPVLGATSLEAHDAPVLLHHVETDTVSGRSWTYAAATCDAVRSAGGTCDLAIGPGTGHTVGLGPGSAEVDGILAFLAVHLRLDG